MGLMGMFDDIQWPDGRRAQVKCFGCEMKLFTMGDTVRLMPGTSSSDRLLLGCSSLR